MIAEIAGGLSALKSASELTKAIIDIRDLSVVQGKAIELQRQILAAQESALAANEKQSLLVEKVRALEAEVARLKEWDTGKDAYRLTKVGTGAGVFVYIPETATDPTKANHWLCVTCYDKRQRSLLQYQGRTGTRGDESLYRCPNCKNDIRVHYNYAPGKG